MQIESSSMHLPRSHARRQDANSDSQQPSDDSGMKLVETLYIYGGIFAILFILFNILRNKFPRLYNPRQDENVAPCELSQKTFSPFLWVWQISKIQDQSLVDQAILDA